MSGNPRKNGGSGASTVDVPESAEKRGLREENALLRTELELSRLQRRDLATQLEALRAKMRSAKRRGRLAGMFAGRKGP